MFHLEYNMCLHSAQSVREKEQHSANFSKKDKDDGN